MGKTPGKSSAQVKVGNRSTVVLSLASLVVICGLGLGAYEAMTRLPPRFVDESSYMTGPANARVPDQGAIENAYNQARVPIGVTAAALLAATAAAAGVVTNNRTVSLGAATLQHASEKDEKDRRQWGEEQFSKRYQDAAAQLGDASAAVRFAGVYALVRLAEEWQTHRQVCIDVLCAYLRMPAPKDQQKNSDDERELSAWRAEWEVRRAILQQIELHCRPAEGDEDGAWSSLRYDWSWSTLDSFNMQDAVFKTLSMYGVTTAKGSAINFRDVRLDGEIDVGQLHVQGGLGFATSGTADLRFSGLNVDGGHLNIKHDTERSHCVLLGGVTLQNKARLTLYVSAGAVSTSITGERVTVRGGSELVLYGEKLFNPARNAIWLRRVYVEEGAKIAPHHDVYGQDLASIEFDPESPVKGSREARIEFRVEVKNPADHILKAPSEEYC